MNIGVTCNVGNYFSLNRAFYTGINGYNSDICEVIEMYFDLIPMNDFTLRRI